MTVGPSFDTELRVAGVTDFRFTWGSDGTFEFHPDMPENERKKVGSVLAAHDGPLSEAKAAAQNEMRSEGLRRIADLFDQVTGEPDLVFAEINAITRAIGIIADGPAATQEDKTDLAAIKIMWATVQSIRDVMASAKADILAANTVEEVQKIKPVFPA